VMMEVILVGTGVQLKLRKRPNAYIAIKWNLNLLVITFLTTLTPLTRVVLRNDVSPSDGDNKRLVYPRETSERMNFNVIDKKQLIWKLLIYWYLMSFFHKKMLQNVWATILPFGPMTLIFYWPKKKISGQP
jgi:hypothetical protein